MPQFDHGTNPMWSDDMERELADPTTDEYRRAFLMEVRDAVGQCDLCNEPVSENDQAEVVDSETGAHHYAHAEGCHDAPAEADGQPHRYSYA